MDWLGSEVADPTGRRYARLDEIFVGRESGRPEFGIVTLLDGPGTDERVAVPLDGARLAADGALVLQVDDDRVRDAPRMRGEVEEIPAEAGHLIREHFGLTPTAGDAAGAGAPPAAARRDADADEAPTEVVRHEEQVTVATRTEATERVVVRKQVVTEDVTITVTLRREELVIERVRIDDAGDAAPGALAFAEEGSEAEFVLHAEEPVVTKRVVPVERVRLHRETSTEDRRITETVRKELVDVDEHDLTREDPLP